MSETLIWLMFIFLTSSIFAVFGAMVTYAFVGRKGVSTN